MHVLYPTAILNRIQVFHCKLIPNTIVITKLERDSKSCKGSQNISTPIAIFYPPSDKYRGVIILRYTGQLVATQDVFFWRLAGRSAPTG